MLYVLYLVLVFIILTDVVLNHKEAVEQPPGGIAHVGSALCIFSAQR